MLNIKEISNFHCSSSGWKSPTWLIWFPVLPFHCFGSGGGVPGVLMVAGPVQSVPCVDAGWFTQAWVYQIPVPFTGLGPWPNGLHIHLSSAQLNQLAAIQKQTDATLWGTTATIIPNPTRIHAWSAKWVIHCCTNISYFTFTIPHYVFYYIL